MTPLPLPAAAEWLHRYTRHRAERTLIALAGLPGSGKTTVAARIASEFNRQAGRPAMVALGMDGFHLPKAGLIDRYGAAGMARRGAPWTFDPAALLDRLRMLRTCHAAVAWPAFAHDIGDPVADAQRVAPDDAVVLVEGLYLLLDDGVWREVGGMFDLRWYLDVSAELARERLIRRHMEAWKLDREAATRRVADNDDRNAEIVAATRSRADVLLTE